ncbi:MAG: CotH kinase family protein [Defluviitaleaceae bacterium]|nr:CotH kinase family protein [Defluviitaleaceae bacterium]
MKKYLVLALAVAVFAVAWVLHRTGTNNGDYTPYISAPTSPMGLGLPFPALFIDTGCRPISNRTDWVDASVSMDNTIESYTFEDIAAQIRGRGNSSWGLPKRPYRIRLEEARTMLCSDHAARNWTLIANHSDKTLMRNYAAYYLAGMLDGMAFAPYARFVDLYINGLYQGVYMLCIQPEVGPGRVQAQGHADPYISEYFIQFDHRQTEGDAVRGLDFVTVNSRHYQIRYPRSRVRTESHAEYVRRFIANAEAHMFRQDEAVFDLICKESFVDFYLVQELFKNQDVGFSSVFMTITGQGSDRRLAMGPVWDFDISAGNAYYQGRHAYQGGYSPQGVWAASVNIWFRALMQMPAFREAVAERWQGIRDTYVRQTIERVDFLAEVYADNFERNFEHWPIMGRYVWPNPRNIVAIDTFRGQVDFLIHFLEERILWMDGFLANP